MHQEVTAQDAFIWSINTILFKVYIKWSILTPLYESAITPWCLHHDAYDGGSYINNVGTPGTRIFLEFT